MTKSIKNNIFIIRHAQSRYNNAWKKFDKKTMTYSDINHDPRWHDSLLSKEGKK